jgi:hypothetical protein
MYKSHLPTGKTFRALAPALAMLLAGGWLSTARADMYVSVANTNGDDVVSFSWITGAAKLDITAGTKTSGVAFGPDGNLYVADVTHGAVLRFNPVSGSLIGTFVSAGSGLVTPEGMTFGPDGNLYVADITAGVLQFNGTTGALLAHLPAGPAAHLGGILFAWDVKFGPDGNIYVSDSNSAAVLKYNGSTLAYMSIFAGPLPGPGEVTPLGIAFGLNNNLYALWYTYQPAGGPELIQFNGSTGAQISGYGYYTWGYFLAVGPDGRLYVPGGGVITKFSAVPPGPGPGTVVTTDSRIAYGAIAFGGPSGIPPYVLFDPVTVTSLQKLRITVVDGPVPVPPGVPVEATLGFLTKGGVAVGPTKVVTLNPGQAASLDLEVSTLISSGRVELQPTVTSVVGTPSGGSLQGSVEVFTASNGVGSVFYPGIPIPASNVTGPPSFVPQGVVYGQSIQINALAAPDSPCVALLSFADINGNPIGPTLNVDLSPGTMTSLTFNPDSITQSAGRQEYVPQIAPSNAGNPAGGPGIDSACLASAEVINQPSSVVATYQISSPAIGTANP